MVRCLPELQPTTARHASEHSAWTGLAMQQTDTSENIAAAAIHSAAKEIETARDDLEHHGRSVRAFIAVVVLLLLLNCLPQKHIRHCVL